MQLVGHALIVKQVLIDAFIMSILEVDWAGSRKVVGVKIKALLPNYLRATSHTSQEP